MSQTMPRYVSWIEKLWTVSGGIWQSAFAIWLETKNCQFFLVGVKKNARFVLRFDIDAYLSHRFSWFIKLRNFTRRKMHKTQLFDWRLVEMVWLDWWYWQQKTPDLLNIPPIFSIENGLPTPCFIMFLNDKSQKEKNYRDNFNWTTIKSRVAGDINWANVTKSVAYKFMQIFYLFTFRW